MPSPTPAAGKHSLVTPYRMARDQARQAERGGRHPRRQHENRARRGDPEIAQRCGQKHRRDMVDREGHGGGGCDIGRIGDLLEIGLQAERHPEQHVIHHIERRGQHQSPTEGIDPAIHQKHDQQPRMLHHQDPPLAVARKPAPDEGRKQQVGQIVDQEKRGQLVHLQAEALHHHEGREHHENLPPRAGHELQQVVKPIAPPQHHMLVLRVGRLELRIGKQANTAISAVRPPDAR